MKKQITSSLIITLILASSNSFAKNFSYSEVLSETENQEIQGSQTGNMFDPLPICPINESEDLPMCRRKQPIFPEDPCSDLRYAIRKYERMCLLTQTQNSNNHNLFN